MGFLSRLTPDSTVYKAIARYITEENGYKYGTGFETVGYNTNGDSDDWFYGDSISKPKSFSMTPECGDAFWMPSAEIIPTCQKLIPQNIKSALVLLDMARLQITSDRTLNGTEGNITWNVQRIGLVNTDSFVLEYSSLSPALTLSAGKSLYRNMQLMEKRSDSVQYLINSTLLTPEGVKVVFRLKYKSLVLQTDTIRFNVSDSLTMVFNSTCGSVSPNWVNRGNRNWTVTSETFVSPSFCIHESPGTSGQANATYILRSQNAIDLQNAEDGILRFYAKWDIEADYDFVQVQASDDTLSWTSLCGIYTQPGTSNQVLDEPVYDGAKLEWVKEEMSLKEFIGKKIWIRYVYKTDAGTQGDGFWLDDVQVFKADSSSMNVGILSIEDDMVIVYPNPFSTELTIELMSSTSEVEKITISDMQGRSVYNLLNHQQSLTFPIRVALPELASGMYAMKVVTKQGEYQKLIYKTL